MIAKEGYPYIIVLATVTVAFYLLWGMPASLPPLIVGMFVLYFFRDPDRNIPNGREFVVSPADGKIIKIDHIDEPDFIGNRTLRISIFMSPFNVHVNRAPLDGIVRKIEHKKGGFKAAYTDLAALENEHVSMLLDTEFGPVLVRQIAGLVARRIVCRMREGDSLKKGQRYGIIKLGSRVDLFLPADAEPLVNVKDRVKAGSTVVAKIKGEQ
jgi:phosphatidylserine decarboxylase